MMPLLPLAFALASAPSVVQPQAAEPVAPAASAAVAPTASACKLPDGASMRIVEYFDGPPTKADDLKCSGNKCSLKGWLYLPKGAKTTPPGAADAAKFEAYQVEYLTYQTYDVQHALVWLAGYKHAGGKLVDKQELGIIGHSFGGALSVLSSGGTFPVNPAAIADIAGAELSWNASGKNPWADYLERAIRQRKVPIYFLQPTNGKSIEPTIVLSQVAARSGNREFQAALFPKIAGNPSTQDVHDAFIGDSDYIETWGPSVRDFFNRYFP